MIAHTNQFDKLRLHLYVSGAIQKFLGIRAKAIPHASTLELPNQWWSVWRAELIAVDGAETFGYALFTNEATLFSFVIDIVRGEFDAAITDFETAFLRQLKTEGLQLPPRVDTHCSLMKGRPNKLIGSMNMFIDHFIVQTDNLERDPKVAEKHLWNIPCGTMGYARPGQAFLQAMTNDPPFGAAIVEPENLIPFPETDDPE